MLLLAHGRVTSVNTVLQRDNLQYLLLACWGRQFSTDQPKTPLPVRQMSVLVCLAQSESIRDQKLKSHQKMDMHGC